MDLRRVSVDSHMGLAGFTVLGLWERRSPFLFNPQCRYPQRPVVHTELTTGELGISPALGFFLFSCWAAGS